MTGSSAGFDLPVLLERGVALNAAITSSDVRLFVRAWAIGFVAFLLLMG